MRRTKATLVYKRTKNLRAVQLLPGHSKLESTVRYLGTEVDDALAISEQTEISLRRHGRALGALHEVVRPLSGVMPNEYNRPEGERRCYVSFCRQCPLKQPIALNLAVL